MHYSVDIILAVFVTTSLWQILCQSSVIAASGVEENGLSLLARMWVSFCNWFNDSAVCWESMELVLVSLLNLIRRISPIIR